MAVRSRWAWLGAFAAIAAYLCGVGHMTLLAHATCAHGDVVHGADAHATAADDSTAGDGTAVTAAPDSEHDHCPSSGVMPALATVAPACPPMTLLEASLLPSRVRLADGVRARSILSFAPKSSPPT